MFIISTFIYYYNIILDITILYTKYLMIDYFLFRETPLLFLIIEK